jgi:hypothetical protein
MSDKDWLQQIIDWILGIFSGDDEDDEPDVPARPLPTVPGEMVGWGPTYCWWRVSLEDTETLAAAMEAAGLNLCPIELFGFGRDKWWNRLPELMPLFHDRYQIFNRHGIRIDLKLINWNWGEGHAENGDIKSCDSRLNDAWFQDILDALKPYSDGLILQACTEWGPGSRNGECWKKAERWCNMAARQWPGLKSWNRGANPDSAPAGHILDYHVSRLDGLGPRTTNRIVTTDTSMILNTLGGLKGHLGNHGKLRDLVKACRRQGCGFSGYTFFDSLDLPQDLAASEGIGQAWRG